MVARVENRMALAFPDLRIDKLACVMPMISANSLLFIFRFETSSICISDNSAIYCKVSLG